MTPNVLTFCYSYRLLRSRNVYSIIDIETTGGAGRQDKITEIAIFKHDGEKVVDKFVSLINPERYIPPNITQITGITNQMVENAPKFFEVAKQIVEITEDTIFLAHNVNFDYSFIKEEFKRLGYNYNRKRLCTVKLARKYIPGHASYSLGKLCSELNININGRHRAEGDAAATVQLYELILKQNGDNILTENKQWVINLPNGLDRKAVETLPDEKGIYYFYNTDGELIYVGKSNNIYSRILSHLGNITSKKAIEMKERIADIGHELTGNELAALLLESEEIKRHKPFYNVAQRRTSYLWGINASYDMFGYINLEIVRNKKEQESQLSFSNKLEARKFIEKLCDEQGICPKLSGIYQSDSSCFNYHIDKCGGACIQKQSADDYNQIAEGVLNGLKYFSDNFAIIEEGRTVNEKYVALIKDGKYKGYGYIDETISIDSLEALEEIISTKEENKDIRSIINGYLNKYPKTKLIKF